MFFFFNNRKKARKFVIIVIFFNNFKVSVDQLHVFTFEQSFLSFSTTENSS